MKISLVCMAALALAGCGDDDAISDDMAVATQSDLSIVDLAGGEIDAGPRDLSLPPPDLTPRVHDLAWSMCAGSKLAGTCAEAFFEPFVACFQPSGACHYYAHNTGLEMCWQSGAKYHAPILGAFWNYSGSSGQCLRVQGYSAEPTIIQFCAPTDASCGSDYDGGVTFPKGGALYDKQTGIFTCTDGTQVDVGLPPTPGIQVGDCSVLNALLDPRALCDPPVFDTSCF